MEPHATESPPPYDYVSSGQVVSIADQHAQHLGDVVKIPLSPSHSKLNQHEQYNIPLNLSDVHKKQLIFKKRSVMMLDKLKAAFTKDDQGLSYPQNDVDGTFSKHEQVLLSFITQFHKYMNSNIEYDIDYTNGECNEIYTSYSRTTGFNDE